MIKILIVDDDKIIRERLKRLLELDDFTAFIAEDGQKGLDLFNRENPEIALVDIKMPGIDGIEVLKQIKKQSKDTEVIIVTGHGTVNTAIQAIRDGAFSYVEKPIDYDELEIEIRRALEKQSLRRELDEYVKALQESEHKFRDIIETTPDWVWEMNAEGIYTYVSPKITDLLGFEISEVLGKSTYDFVPEPEKEEVTTFMEDQMIRGSSYTGIERLNCNKAGNIVTIETSGVPITDDSGTITGYRGIDRDITERKRAANLLQWESNFNAAIAKLSGELISPTSIDEISYLVLEEAKKLTNSKYGFVGYIDPNTNFLISTTMTRDIWDGCSVQEKSIVFKECKGLFGWVIHERKSFLTNDPDNDPRSTGTPKGHIPINRFLSAPSMVNDVMVGLISLANSDTDYTERDLQLIERFASLYALAVERMRSQEQIEASLKEKEILLKEIHHRVKNNMQLISSLLSLQAKYIDDPKILDKINESQERVYSMAIIHEMLYKSEDLSQINLDQYVESLSSTLYQTYEVNPANVKLRIDIDKTINIDINRAIPCGLILNELLTNTFKYAFPEGKKGEIYVEVKSDSAGQLTLIIGDTGIGIPGGMNWDKITTLGLELVRDLTRQLRGTVTYKSTNGAQFTIIIKE